MGGDAITSDEAPATLPTFDSKAARRAIRRGMLRTAAIAAVLSLAVLLLGREVAFVNARRGGDDFNRFLHGAHAARYADYWVRAKAPNYRTDGFGSHFSISARLRTPDRTDASPEFAVAVERDLWGRVKRPLPVLPVSRMADVLVAPAAPAEQTILALDGLPSNIVVTAIVELRSPLDEAGRRPSPSWDLFRRSR